MYYYNYGNIYSPRTFGSTYPNQSMDYWARSLFQRLTALFDFKGLPQAGDGQYGWDKDAFKYGLYMLGYLAVFRSKTYGVVPQPGTITGYGLQYQPTGVMIATPYFQLERPLKIGVETELIKLTPDYASVYDIVTKYAAELKEIETAIRSSVRDARFGYMLAASDDKTARTLKAAREKILNGDDVIMDEKIARKKPDGSDPWYMFNRDIRNSFVLPELLEARRTTLVDFYREIGVRMLDDKKERMLTAEVDAGNAETFIRSEVWSETLKESIRKVNEMFGTNIEAVINTPDFAGGDIDAV